MDDLRKYRAEAGRQVLLKAELAAQKVAHIVDQTLIGVIEKIEGHVPSDKEIGKHGTRLIQPNGDWTFLWKNRKVLRVDFWPDNVNIYPCDEDGNQIGKKAGIVK